MQRAAASYATANRARFLEALFALLRQRSVSAEGDGVAECAELVSEALQSAGLENVQALAAPGHPVLYGDWLHAPGAPTVLLYGHYDVQPADAAEWTSDPFEPTIRDGRIFARGAGDDKGQFFAHLCAIESLLATAGRLPANVKVILEGEEEIGSPHIEGVVAAHRELLGADLAYTSDGSLHESSRPTLICGVRGILYVDVHAVGSDRDHHSGNKGNLVPNAAWRLVDFLGSLRDPRSGRVLIAGFYDDVRGATASEREALRAIPYDERSVAAHHGLADLGGASGEEIFHRLMLEPTLTICGIHAGVDGPGMRTSIPHTARAKVDMRLVADQDPDRVWQAFHRHAAAFAPHVSVTRAASMRPSRTPVDLPIVRRVARALGTAPGGEPIVMPSLGGSLPDHVFTSTLGVPSVIVPYANHDQGNHGPDENLRLDLFERGILTTCAVLAALGETAAAGLGSHA